MDDVEELWLALRAPPRSSMEATEESKLHGARVGSSSWKLVNLSSPVGESTLLRASWRLNDCCIHCLVSHCMKWRLEGIWSRMMKSLIFQLIMKYIRVQMLKKQGMAMFSVDSVCTPMLLIEKLLCHFHHASDC